MDVHSDNLMQKSLRESFPNQTLLVVAHRISTILDSDLIIVLDNGKIAEQGTPQELLGRQGSIFRELAKSEDEQ